MSTLQHHCSCSGPIQRWWLFHWFHYSYPSYSSCCCSSHDLRKQWSCSTSQPILWFFLLELHSQEWLCVIIILLETLLSNWSMQWSVCESRWSSDTALEESQVVFYCFNVQSLPMSSTIIRWDIHSLWYTRSRQNKVKHLQFVYML